MKPCDPTLCTTLYTHIQERDFRLSVLDENSKAATVSVSLNIDPPTGVNLTSRGRDVKGVAVFDSERMPVVNMG